MLRFSQDKERSHISEVIKKARRKVINDVGKERSLFIFENNIMMSSMNDENKVAKYRILFGL